MRSRLLMDCAPRDALTCVSVLAVVAMWAVPGLSGCSPASTGTAGTGGAVGTGGAAPGTGGATSSGGTGTVGSGGVSGNLGGGGGSIGGGGSTRSGGASGSGVGGTAGANAGGATMIGGGGGGVSGHPGAGGRGGQGGQGGNAGNTGGVCMYGGSTHAVGTSFPSSDGCNTCSCTAGGGVACTLRACVPDAGTDAAMGCALDSTYAYGQTGGHVAYQDEVTLTPPASYQHRRHPSGAATVDLMCAPALPACNGATALDVGDVLHDLADADVQRALAAATPPLYGSDPRAFDGSLFSFRRADGRGFLAGGPCDGGGGGNACVPVPAGIARLVATLVALDQQQLKDPTCAQLR